jgi:hypothetical protein
MGLSSWYRERSAKLTPVKGPIEMLAMAKEDMLAG